MRRLGLVMSVLSAAVLALSLNFKAYAASDSKAEITELEHKLIAATSADEAMKYYDDKDADVYDFGGPPLEYDGSEAVHGDFDNFFSNAKDIKGEFVKLVVISDGKLGVARSIQHFTWTGKDGKPAEATIRVTDVLHKVKGDWKIMHSHISVPVDPKTGQAQMNLKS